MSVRGGETNPICRVTLNFTLDERKEPIFGDGRGGTLDCKKSEERGKHR